MSDDTRCDWCLRPMRQPDEWTAGMTDEQRRACCWGRPSDARCGEIHETEAWPKMLAEVARLREQVAEEHAAWAGVTEQWKHALGKLDEATEEIATLRLAIGTPQDAQVLSPLSVSPAEPMLICPSCQCAWPELMPGHEDTVTCACGRVLGCARREPL